MLSDIIVPGCKIELQPVKRINGDEASKKSILQSGL